MAGIYIHVPFCRQRCSYCDFYFVTSHKQVDAFAEAVCDEMRMRSEAVGEAEPVRTIYFGGGTPSRLETDHLASILDAVCQNYDTSGVEEITVEVNPDDPDSEYLRRLLDIGVTRLSIGLQSLDEQDLTFMLRSHTSRQALSFIEMSLAAGFESLSVDLIFGLPDMSTERWRKNLEYAIASGAHHVSLYGLTVEPRTLLGKWVRAGTVSVAPESVFEQQFRLASQMMTEHGFEHYEISNFALPGHRSRHNQSYWNHSNYLGFGPAAHSFWRSKQAVRWENVRSLRGYLDDIRHGRLPVSFEEALDAPTLLSEYVLLGLRTETGVDLNVVRESYGHDLTREGRSVVAELEEMGKLITVDGRLVLTLSGRLVADSATSSLLTGGAFAPIHP